MAKDSAQFLSFLVKDIRHALQEEHAEDGLLVFGGVHRATQDVGGFHQKGMELGEDDTQLHGFDPSGLRLIGG